MSSRSVVPVPGGRRGPRAVLAVTFAVSLTALAQPVAQADPAVSDASARMARVTNEYRARHAVAGLEVSASLESSAQKWADRGEFKHSDGDSRYGENLYASREPCTEADLRKAVDLWYAEEKDYDYGHPDTAEADRREFAKGTGHFTQLVWKGSERIGVGIASHPGRQWQCLVVAQYGPPGNYMGEFRENVLRPR